MQNIVSFYFIHEKTQKPQNLREKRGEPQNLNVTHFLPQIRDQRSKTT